MRQWQTTKIFGRTLAFWVAAALIAHAGPIFLPHHHKPPLDVILARMNDSSRRLKTVSANIEYTNVTIAVNVRDTKSGKFYLRKGDHAEIMLDFLKPNPEKILVTSKKAQIYDPKTDEIQVADLSRHPGLVNQFLLLGFGTSEYLIKRDYTVVLAGEVEIGGDTTAHLDLTPQRAEVKNYFPKIELWVSEESWLPVKQRFYQSDGDFLSVRYADVEVNRGISHTFFHLPKAKRIKLN